MLNDVDRATDTAALAPCFDGKGFIPRPYTAWRKKRDAAMHKLFAETRAAAEAESVGCKNEKLRRQNRKLQEDLEKAHSVIDVQKSGQALGLSPGRESPTGRSDQGRARSASSFSSNEASMSGVVDSARNMVSASTTRSCSCCRVSGCETPSLLASLLKLGDRQSYKNDYSRFLDSEETAVFH